MFFIIKCDLFVDHNKDLNIFNQIRSSPIYLLSGLYSISLYIKSFYYLVNLLTFIESIIRLVILIKLTYI